MITREKMPWSFIKFSQHILWGNVWRSVWRICMWILGLKGLMTSSHLACWFNWLPRTGFEFRQAWLTSLTTMILNWSGWNAFGHKRPLKIIHSKYILQGCVLRKIEESPTLWFCKSQGAQHYDLIMICMKNLRFSSRPWAKVWRQGHRALLEHNPVLDVEFYVLYIPRITTGEANFHAMGHHGEILYPIIVSMSLAKRLAPYPQAIVSTSNKAKNNRDTPPDW